MNLYIRVGERLKTFKLKLENLKKISRIHRIITYLVLSPAPEIKILSVLVKISWKTEIELLP